MNNESFREILACDKVVFDQYVKTFRSKRLLKLTDDHVFQIRKYILYLRYSQYYKNCFEQGNLLSIFPYVFCARRMNKLGNKLGFYISTSARIGKGFWIYHHGCVIINGNASIGDYCRLHGSNCIGNRSMYSDKAPTIGNNCDIGFGATLIGDIYVADNVVVGANAVVNKSCVESNVVLAGVPADIKKRKSDKTEYNCSRL